MLTKNQFNYVFRVALLFPLSAWTAENGFVVLEDIQVIGDNVSIDRFEDPPLSAQLFLPQEIKQRRINAVQDLTDDIPNFHISSAGSTGINDIVSIRGLTNTLVFGNSPVSIYVDDVPFGDPITFANYLYGVESIEVFKGPQSSLFGQNSYGGSFNVTNRSPGEKLQSHFSLEGGNFDYRAVNGTISGPLVQNQVSFSLAGAYSKRDGFLKNTFLNIRPDKQEYTGGRSSLIWTPLNAWKISFSASVDNFNDGAIQVVPLDGEHFKVQSNVSGKTKQFIDTESLKIHYLANTFEILSVTARRNWKLDPRTHDFDLSPAPIVMTRQEEEVEQWSQEFRIQSPENFAQWDWRLGVFGLFSKGRSNNMLAVFANSEKTQDETDENSYAGFAYINYKGIKNTELNAGLRIDYVDSRIDRQRQGGLFGPVPAGLKKQQNSFFFISPKIGFSHLLLPQISLYGSTQLAFKPGGFTTTDLDTFSGFDQESMWASELGVKSRWLNNQVRANLAVFYYDIEDYQVERMFTPTEFFVVNAPEATSYGVELEFFAKTYADFEVEAIVGYTHIEFDKFRDPITKQNLAGNTAPFVPEYNYLLALQHPDILGFNVRVELVGKGKTYFDDFNNESLKQNAYEIINARLGYSLGSIEIYGFVNNLGDKEYFTQKFSTTQSGSPGNPRTYGVGLQFGF